MVENFIPSVMARYRQQILFPVLRLLLALLMSQGGDNLYAVNQVHVTFLVESSTSLRVLMNLKECVNLLRIKSWYRVTRHHCGKINKA